ncbi:GntR family transcriptional regulator [Gordonia phthalatica]|uniref:GntR family transcriptional regulator n=1 Tax=Gordonia phthalatica TaxID=1136941 RepID=A0A0N9N4Q0_9ACTN|nr:GntR family transcriptional regulator [Gordonia phthalatica]ALG85400.1 GntR family transcriptional regulator [Gordonia phthalatica]
MLFRIDPTADTPIFTQIADNVRGEAAAGRLSSGQRLPSAREVAGSLGVNVHTVLHAYQDLRDEGLVELRRGRGAVVTDAADTLASMHDDIRKLAAKAANAGLPPQTVAALIQEALREHN